MRDGTPSQAKRYRVLFESNPLPLWVYDIATLRILDVNEVACRKYGYTRDEFLALTIRDIRPPEDIPLVEAAVREALSKAFGSGLWRHRLKDGTLINVEIMSHELTYMGRAARFVCPIDVTQHVRTESALQEREAGLHRAQMMARLSHVITRPEGSFESWSQTLPQLAGLDASQMPRSTREWMQLVVHPDDRQEFRARALEAATSGSGVELEYRLLRPDGRVVHVRQAMEPIDAPDSEGHTRWFSTLQDVSDQKRLNEELEQRVRDRTAQLLASNRELALATAAAERASRAKSEFLSNMSHELRTPLNAVVGFGQLLASSDEALRSPRRQAMFVDHIVNAGRHLLTLINEILDLAQIESGRPIVRLDRSSLTEAFAECEAMLEPMAAQRGIRLAMPVVCDIVAMADRTRLKQVLLNLLSNAVKYNRERGTVVVDCARVGAERVRISVRDSGPGLRREQIDALFQPYNRLGQETGSTEGTGIGLVVTKQLVELMGGHIGVESTPGAGSVFWIELRAETAPAASGATAVRAAEPAHAAQAAPQQDSAIATVLCVDDSPVSVRLVQEMLASRSDVQLLSASNGKLGVELARAHLPAVILMDNNMPELSGREAQAILRNDPRTAAIPIIALSANAMPEAVDTGLAAGFFRYITKPFDMQELLNAVDDALKISKAKQR